MPTVSQVTFDLLRRNGMTTIFGNPGSNELPFLAEMPADFRYVLGLSENVVMGMADGYAQASRAAAFVNLHAAAGTGNAMGALTNAQAAHSPLVITAGQQVRSTVGLQVMLSNIDAAALPQPLVKWSGEPLDASDVPRSISQAIHLASAPPQGPVYLSIPYDDWRREADGLSDLLPARTVDAGGRLSPEQLDDLVAALDRAESPVLIVGPDVDISRANASVVALAEKLRAPVWIAPSASRCPFPTTHPFFRGVLPASIAGIGERLRGHDVVLVVGAPVFRYHEYEPGELLAPETELIHLTCDPGEAARAPMGRALIVDIASALDALCRNVAQTGRPVPAAHVRPEAPRTGSSPFPPEAVFATVNALTPEDVVYVNEATSTVKELWAQLDMEKPGSYYFPAAGGLGYGLPAALGVQLAHPERRVVAFIGDGSANYSICGLWTAVQEKLPIVFIILNNGTYGALKSFATKLGAETAPGIDIPGIDFCSLAAGYGVESYRISDLEELASRVSEALASDGPTLLEVPIQTVAAF